MANTAPRPGITFEQVAAAADSMLGQGVTPTIQNVRDTIGGSPNTVHRHLTAWREALPKQAAEAPALPPALAAAFAAEISRATAEARSEIETKLVQVQKESADLAAAGEVLETERDNLAELVQELTDSNNILTGRNGEQASEITRLAADLERERIAADQKTTDLAQVRNRVQSLTEALAEKSAAMEKLTLTNTAETQSRIEAEKGAAVLQAQLTAALVQVEDAKAREGKAVKETTEKTALIGKLTAEIAAETKARTEAERASAVLQAQLTAIQEQVKEVKAREDKAVGEVEKERNSVARAHDENKELQGRIEAQAGKIAEQTAELASLKVQTAPLNAPDAPGPGGR
jgi:colicin import membrane protein